MHSIVRALSVTAIVVIVAFAAWSPGPRAQDAPAFLGGIEDLPLMPGLVENADYALVFDSPSGRYVEAFVVGAVKPNDVVAFYRSTLPQLGWRADTPMRYRREGEILVLEFLPDGTSDEALTMRFSLSPE